MGGSCVGHLEKYVFGSDYHGVKRWAKHQDCGVYLN